MTAIEDNRKPLPTVPGLYTLLEEDTKINIFKRLLLTTEGNWFWIDFTASNPTTACHRVVNLDYLTDPDNNYDLTLVYGGVQ